MMLNAFYAFIGTLSFAILFNIRGRKIIVASVGGGLGWLFYLVSLHESLSTNFSLFIASLVISIYSEFMARIFKAPVTIFLICAMIPLVPGNGMYYTMLESVKGNTSYAINLGFQTISNAGAIAIAIVLVASLARLFTQRKTLFQEHC